MRTWSLWALQSQMQALAHLCCKAFMAGSWKWRLGSQHHLVTLTPYGEMQKKKMYGEDSVVFHCKKTLNIFTESYFPIFFYIQLKAAAFYCSLSLSSFPWHNFAHWNVTWTKSLLSKILAKLLFNSRHIIISPKIYSPAKNKKLFQGHRISPTIISWHSVKENGTETSVGHWGIWGAAEDCSCLFKLRLATVSLYWTACAALCNGQRGAC